MGIIDTSIRLSYLISWYTPPTVSSRPTPLINPAATPKQSTPTLPDKPRKLPDLLLNLRQASISRRKSAVPRHRRVKLLQGGGELRVGRSVGRTWVEEVGFCMGNG